MNKKLFLGTLLSSFLSGMFISIGGCVYLSLASTLDPLQKVLGAVFFCVGLISICLLGLYLYTGKIAYAVEDHSLKNILTLLLGIVGNFAGTTLFGTMASYVNKNWHEYAKTLCNTKTNLNLWGVLFLAFMCGVLMYVAVNTYKTQKTIMAILFCIPVFILSGFEHSIADMFYFAVARVYSLKYLAFILIVIIGNGLGAMLVPFIKKFIKE